MPCSFLAFLSKDDLQMFRLLLGILESAQRRRWGFLQGFTADELRFAVLSDDAKLFPKLRHWRKKTAQKMILELKDKLSLEDALSRSFCMNRRRLPFRHGEYPDGSKEAIEALVALGYSSGGCHAGGAAGDRCAGG